ncbi:MAG: hypothetical protein ACRDTI_20695 [Mycobacterium sp.]
MSNASHDFLAGGGPPSGKFPTKGDTVGGKIVSEPVVQQQRDPETQELETWPDGNAKMQLVVTVQTDLRDPTINDDDGKRRIFVKGQMKSAVQTAVQAVGASGLDVGGELYVTYKEDGEKKNKAFNAPKIYIARYVPPAADAAQFLGTAEPAAAVADSPAAAADPLAGLSPETLAALAALQKQPA